ncbi:nucleoporin subcomplex protein binding to Pom34-domain-containing protein [Phellopilus nigrolimitatus]|nr:nucleoporin subcomplex protein binding to Pom34-domain-containing protein [Phellopilus nigrolimitatus]
MASSSSTRSQLIDFTYNHVASLVDGHREGTRPDQITKILETRVERLKKISEPFDKPSDASKRKVESGSVQLTDGVMIQVENADKEVVFAISERFQIDQVDALVLLRSFLYNEGLPETPDSESKSSLIDELLAAITPFYFSERLHVARTLIALVKCQQSSTDAFSHGAHKLLPKIVTDQTDFVMKLISEFLRKAKLPIPAYASKDPKTISQWAKQNAKEQLVLVETLFWMLWDYVPCTTPIVVSVFESAYEADFGYNQENSTSMLDDEGMQIQRDIAALWVLITIEVLNLESFSGTDVELPTEMSDTGPFPGSPLYMLKVHKIVMHHTSPGYVCTMLAWAFYLKAISEAASRVAERPRGYPSFLREIKASSEVAFKKGEKELHATIVAACLRPESGLFGFLSTLLTQSPLFVSSVAWKTGSSVSFPNEIAYRALLKGLPVELIPDFDGFVETWIALFGNCESAEGAGLCRQYWDIDWRLGKARRAVIDVARSRFPVQFRPLVRLLRAMSEPDLFAQTAIDEPQHVCSNYVFYYFRNLPTYTQVITVAARTGANALYDRMIDRPGPSSTSGGTAYTNMRPIIVPGGSSIPAKSVGRLLCSDSTSDPVIVAWQHEHSGWKVLVDVLIDYINRRQGSSRAASRRVDAFHGRRADAPVTLQLGDIGIDREGEDEATIADALELVLSIIQGNVAQTEQLMQSLEEGGSPVSYTSRDASPPDLVQLIFMILEDALSRAQSRRLHAPSALVAPALGVLSSLLSLPNYSNRVWLYLRSTTMLFGTEREANFSSAILSAERSSGQYVMTLALLRLVRTLFEEAIASLLVVQAEQPRLQVIKEDVLLRAMRFVHGQIWVEHSGWRYTRLGDRFEIGRSIVALYARVIQTMSAVTTAHTFASLSEFVLSIMIYQASSSTVIPLVHTIASGKSILATLASLRRFAEVRRYTSLLENSIRLIRLVLHLKTLSTVASKLTLIEQALCADHSLGNVLIRSRTGRVNPVDMLAYYVKQRELGVLIPREAVCALTALCTSLSGCSPSPPSIIGYLSDAQATMASLIKILRHPYDDLPLRNALWNFVCVAVEKQPALAVLFVAGQFRITSAKGKEKGTEVQEDDQAKDLLAITTKSASAVEAACETLSGWKELWEANPQLLASVMSFLDVVWSRNLEHITTLEPTRGDSAWPCPDYTATREMESEEGNQSELHDAVGSHAYRTKIKSHALRILGSDIAMHLRSSKENEKLQPTSYKEAALIFQTEEHVTESIAEAVSSSYDPGLYDQMVASIGTSFAHLTVDSLQSPEPINEREFGDNFMLSVPLLHDLLRLPLASEDQKAALSEQVQYLVYSVNLNMSLAHSQLFLAESWCFLLEQVKGYLRGNPGIRAILLATAASVSRDIANERRSGDFMSTIHGGRLRLLLGLLEAAWFPPSETQQQTRSFMLLLESVGGIISSEAFPPGKSFLGAITKVFHRSLLQIVYFCAKNCQQLSRNSQIIKAEHRLLMGRTFTAASILVIDALRLSFDTARTRLDVELDKDMELLVAVFQQCTRQGLHSSSTAWLTRCQETDVINASLKLLSQTDISGFSDFPLLRSRGQPLYSPQVLSFHMALASIPFTAERLASENVIATYCNNSISAALSEGALDTALSELPGERSPAHKAYCLILANVTGMISNLVSPQQFVESQIVGLVQLYGKQISRTLSWSNDDPLTVPFLEELELTVELFYLMAEGSVTAPRNNSALPSVLRAFTEHALQLLQQLNYALTHPKHLTGLLESVSTEERIRIDREMTDLSMNTLNELLDEEKRPIAANVVRRLLGVTTNVLSTLNILGGAETVLLSDPEDWPIREALVVPHSKVTMGEPASIGTLLELGNCAYETLHFLTSKKMPPLSNRSLAPPSTPRAVSTLQPSVRMIRQTLETVLVYTSTQLVMWLTKHDGEQTGEMELDDPQQHSEAHGYGYKADASTTKDRERERRLKRKSLTLADRLRRGMTGEMTMDLQALVDKAKPVVAKSSEVLGKPEPVDLLQVLAIFLEERLIAAP